MDAERWQRIEAVLDAVLDLPHAERAAFLQRACGDDVALIREVSVILAAGERADSLLDDSARRLAAPILPNESPLAPVPDHVGPYRIERVIGEGGMGTVYLAHRDDGEFTQRVALKVVRLGLHLDARIVRRFREERQILAALSHPGIARIVDGGVTDDGLPFFAMEYVDGLAIDRYCEAQQLGIDQRLELFVRICDALAHAHGKQIVHRDIKPSNILVTGNGEPRLLDFGIAKLLGPYDAGGALATATRRSERLLTPEYASPEQIRGEPVVIASDVYGLGVLLYELLTGQRPFRRAERTAHELQRAVLEDEPTRPSHAARGEPLRRQLKGDLDTIILTAMSKEPERRYASAREMGADVRRHLAGEPVTARGASPVYRARRWAGRHRIALATAMIVAVAATVIATVVARTSAPQRVVAGNAQRIAVDPELALDAELSPDAKRVAFVAGTGTAMQLYVANLDGTNATLLGAGVPGFQRWPRWSPDGRHIAVLAGSRIYDVNADGTGQRLLVSPEGSATFVAFPAWSPDGREIAYVQDGAVFARAVSGGAPRRLAVMLMTPHSLRWSPDGTKLALVSGNAEFALGTFPWVSITNVGNAGPSSILVVPAQGGTPTRITSDRALNTSPVWTPDSRGLLYISSRGGTRDVYRVALDRHGQRRGEPQRITTGLGAHTISLSADGRLLVYSVFRLMANIWSVTASPNGGRPVAEATPITRGAQSVEGLALSNDGQWLTFDSDRNGKHHIYTVSAGGGDAKQITSNAVDEFMPHWSPDARQIAFHAFTPEGARRLEVVSADGGASSPVTLAPRNQRRPGWSPDGHALVFDAGMSTGGDIYLVEQMATGGWSPARRLTTTGGGAARWSPDGRDILYVREDGIWVVARAGGEGRQVLRVDPSEQLRLGNAEWSRDGARIFYKRYDGEGRTTFWSVPATGGTPRVIVRLDREQRSHRPEFATDGRRFFFTVTERMSDIWSMELRTVR